MCYAAPRKTALKNARESTYSFMGDVTIISLFTRTGARARVPEARDALHVIVHILGARKSLHLALLLFTCIFDTERATHPVGILTALMHRN